jgi:hypothetical protein
MARAAVEKGTGSCGYAQARVLERACYLGILARKSGWADVVTNLKERLTKFDASFVSKYIENVQGVPEGFDPYAHAIARRLPHPHQVALELLNWGERFDYELTACASWAIPKT